MSVSYPLQILESVAGAVQGITDAPASELSQAAQDSALGALQTVAGGGTALTPAAASAATAALSSVALAAAAAAMPAGRRRALLLAGGPPVEPRTEPPRSVVHISSDWRRAPSLPFPRQGIPPPPPAGRAPAARPDPMPPPSTVPPQLPQPQLARPPQAAGTRHAASANSSLPSPPVAAAGAALRRILAAAAEDAAPPASAPPPPPPPPPLALTAPPQPPAAPAQQPLPAAAPPPLPQAPLPAAATLAAIMATLDSLHSSLQSLFSVPGESPAVLTAPAITMVSQLDSPAAGSRLFSERLAAPGGGSGGFEPLPPGLLLNATTVAGRGGGAAAAANNATSSSLATSAGVQTQFLSLGFTPYPPGSATGPNVSVAQSVTRLKFATGDTGDEIVVANLTEPVRFSIPAPEGGVPAGRGAVCQFWDPRAGLFSGAGCAALPLGAPVGHDVAWATARQILAASSFRPPPPLLQASSASPPSGGTNGSSSSSCTAALDEQGVAFFNPTGSPAIAAKQLAVSWLLSGPAACGCAATVLDCASAAGRARKVYLSPKDAILVPAVSCPANSTAAMLVFYGARCFAHACLLFAILSARLYPVMPAGHHERILPSSFLLQARRASSGGRTPPSAAILTPARSRSTGSNAPPLRCKCSASAST